MTGSPSDVALLERIVDVDARIARLEAERAAAMCAFVDLRRSEPVEATAGEQARVMAGEFAADEIAAAVGWSTGRVRTEVARYRRLRSGLPRTWALWRDGVIDGYTAGKVAEIAGRLTRPDSAEILDAEAAERAPTTTAAQLGAWLNRRVARLEPDRADRRHRRAHKDRKVCTTMEPDGMGSLWAMSGAADINAIDARLTDLARKLGADDPRTMDQRRADLFVDHLLDRGSEATSGPASDPAVAVVVPVQSLLGVDDTPGELADRSATVPAPLAREIAARPGTLFYRLLTDESGNLLDVSRLGRYPSNLLGFAVGARDGTCRWPTCTTPASRCDHDHTVPWPDGPTSASNLGQLCRRHHRAKTHADFDLDQPEPGTFVWRTPTGHRYLADPEPLPVGRWPQPTVIDTFTPLTELIDLLDDTGPPFDDTGPPLDETTTIDALPPWAGHDLLLDHEIAALQSGPAP